MEPDIKRLTGLETVKVGGIGMTGRLDRRSLLTALMGGAAYWLLAVASLWLTRLDMALAAVWLPNAFAVAVLMRARISNELPFFAAILVASGIGNLVGGTPPGLALLYSCANTLGVVTVVTLTRRLSGPHPDMTKVSDLATFIWAGGLVGPIASCSVISMASLHSPARLWDNALAWFLAESMAMLLIVPVALLAIDAWVSRRLVAASNWAEYVGLLALGLLAVFLIFNQSAVPLLFLIPPITMLYAFRLGSFGSAIFVILVAIAAIIMTQNGNGPLALMDESDAIRMHVIQAFIAANFLTALPVAAVLAGQRRMMERVERNKRELDMLGANISDAILRYDLDGYCSYATLSVRDVLGVEPEDFLGSRLSDGMHNDASERIRLAEQRLLQGESEKERFTYRRVTGADDSNPVFVEAECALARNPVSGDIEGIVVSARDVTERVELELLLTRARCHAENAARAKSEFLANMSHEIRTPMNGVLGFAELMLESDLDSDQLRHAKMIVESGRSMMLLLNDILDLSKIEAGQITIDPAPVDMLSIMQDCVALHRPTAEKKGLDIRMQFDAETTALGRRETAQENDGPSETYPWVLTDGLRVRQILLNLIGNAVKFTEDGHIHVDCEVTCAQIKLRVIDTGIGISEMRLETIFRPFTQAENDTARHYGGTGLGLSISHQLANLLGGRINVESKAGAGSCFTLTLPTRLVPPDLKPVQKSAESLVEDLRSDRLKSSRILLAEDHDINRELVTEMLEKCGQRVDVAYDGNETISMVIDSVVRGEPFDLILMDIQMPGCDGFAATRTIRAEGIGPNELPIIALTANAFPEDIAAAREAGMQAHLAKPLVFADLARALQRWLPTRIIDERERTPEKPVESETNQSGPSKALMDRWIARRAEAIDAVRTALDEGVASLPDTQRDALAQHLHALAGTAAMFGEVALGKDAAVFERALRNKEQAVDLDAIAQDLLHSAETEETGQMRQSGSYR